MVGSIKLCYFCKSDVLAIQGHPSQNHWFWHQSKTRMRLPTSLS